MENNQPTYLELVHLCQKKYQPLVHKGILLSQDDFFILIKQELPTLSNENIIHDIWQDFHDLYFIKDILLDSTTEELIIQNDGPCFIYQRQKPLLSFCLLYHSDVIKLIFNILCLKEQQMWNVEYPFRSFRCQLQNQSFRLSIMHQCLSPQKNHKIFLRTQHTRYFDWHHFHGDNVLKSTIEYIIKKKLNLMIVGPTRSGKTSLINTLFHWLPHQEHIVILEETHELRPPSHLYHVTHFLQQLHKDKGPTLVDFCEYALRISPERFILGELRHQEILAFLLMLNNGHQGLISTFHASSAESALERLALLACFFATKEHMSWDIVLKLFASHIQYIIYMENKKIHHLFQVESVLNGKVHGQYLWGSPPPQKLLNQY